MNRVYKVKGAKKFKNLLIELENLGCIWYGSRKSPSEFKRHNVASNKPVYVIVEGNEITWSQEIFFKMMRSKYEDYDFVEYGG